MDAARCLILILLLPALIRAGTPDAPSGPPAPEPAAVSAPALAEESAETVARRCFAALVAGDAEAVRDCLAPQSLDSDPGGTGVRRAVRYFSHLYDGLGRPDWALDTVKIRRDKASAVFSLADETVTLDLIRTDGTWKVLL